ncbi:MAG: AAA family ATPase [Thaumarchaeota archaeon]|nr:AAA family ATPase [Nitrososphaerota archaeon]
MDGGDISGEGEEFRRIILITGTPGVGKHTVARALQSRMEQAGDAGWQIVDINEVARAEGLLDAAGGYDPASDTTDVDANTLSDAARGALAAPGRYIVVGHLAPYVVPADDVILAAVLRRNPYELIRVYEEREYSERKAKENAGAEMLGTISFDTYAARYGATGQYDTTGRGAQETARVILADVGRLCRGGGSGDGDGLAPQSASPDSSDTGGTWEPGERIGWHADKTSYEKMLRDIMPGWPGGTV